MLRGKQELSRVTFSMDQKESISRMPHRTFLHVVKVRDNVPAHNPRRNVVFFGLD